MIIIIGKYCPINNGLICTSVYGFGLIGVWRMLHFEFSKCDEEAYLDLIQDTKICQPENCGYYLYMRCWKVRISSQPLYYVRRNSCQKKILPPAPIMKAKFFSSLRWYGDVYCFVENLFHIFYNCSRVWHPARIFTYTLYNYSTYK